MENILDKVVIDFPTIFMEGIESVLGIIGIAMLLLSIILDRFFNRERSAKIRLIAVALLLLGLLLFVLTAIYSQNYSERKKELYEPKEHVVKAGNEVIKESELKPDPKSTLEPLSKSKLPPKPITLPPPKPIKREKAYVHWNKRPLSNSVTTVWELEPSTGYKLIPNSVKFKYLKKGRESNVQIISRDSSIIKIRASTKNYGGFLGRGQARGHVEIKVNYQELKN